MTRDSDHPGPASQPEAGPGPGTLRLRLSLSSDTAVVTVTARALAAGAAAGVAAGPGAQLRQGRTVTGPPAGARAGDTESVTRTVTAARWARGHLQTGAVE